MNREEAIAIIRKEYLCVDRDCDIERNCGKCDLMMPSKEPILEAYSMAIKALDQDPCDNCKYLDGDGCRLVFEQAEYGEASDECPNDNNELPSVNRKRCDDCIWSVCNYNKVDWESVTPQPKTGYWIFDDECKEHGHCSCCGYGSVDLVDGESHNFCRNCGAKLIVEPQERNDKDADKKCTYKETGCGSCKRQLDCPIEADTTESEDKA